MTRVIYNGLLLGGFAEEKRMKVPTKLHLSIALLAMTSYSQAAVDVTGFTITGGGTPVGLFLIVAIIAGLGLASLKHG